MTRDDKPKIPVTMSDPFHLSKTYVGMDLFLEVKRGGKVIKTKSELAGYVRGKFIILHDLMLGGSAVGFSPVGELVVRYLHDGSVYGFRTKFRHSLEPPFNLTLLDYPDTVETVTLRESSRIQVVIPIERAGTLPGMESIMDVSATGAQVLLQEAVMVGDKLALSFNLPHGKRVENIECAVQRVNMTRTAVTAGIRFDKTHEHYAHIHKYMDLVLKAMADFSELQGQEQAGDDGDSDDE